MDNILKELQNLAVRLAPFVLLEVGFVLVWLGLCLWLGGLRWLKFFAGLSAAAIGYALTCCFTDGQMYFLIGVPVLAGLAAICFEKATVVFLAGILIAAVVNLALVWPTLNDPSLWHNPPAASLSAAGQEAAVGESLKVLGNYAVWIGRNIYNSAKTLGSMNGAVYGVVILAVAALGLIIPRGICSFICSILGVMMIAAGMFFLLLYKGSKPADIFLANPGMFGLIAGGMLIFGMLINLAIAPAKARKKAVSPTAAE